MAQYKEAGQALATCPSCGKMVEGKRLESLEKHGVSLPRVFLAFMTLGVSLLFAGFRQRTRRYFFKCPRCKAVSEMAP